MLEVGGQPRPEAAARKNFPVGGTGVVVGADGGRRRNVGLAQDGGGDEEGGVVVLLVEGKDEVVQKLAAGHSGVVPQE